MKILYVFFHSYTDMPYHTREWVEAAIELGHKVTVITSIDPIFLKSVGWEEKINVRQVKYSGKGLLNYIKNLKAFKTAIDSELNDSKKFDLLYERFSTISLATALAAKQNHILYSTEINGILDQELKLSRTSYLRRFILDRIQSYVYKRSSGIIAVTSQIATWISGSYKIPAKNIKTISNGVNTKRFYKFDKKISRIKFNLPQNAFIIGYLGTLVPWYDLPILIRNAQELIKNIPEVYFLIGGGQEPMHSELISMVKKANLQENFLFSGQIHWNDAAAFTSCFDIAIAPIRFSNSQYKVSPLKLASYMACERPILASNTPGMKEIIEETRCGMIYIDDKSFVSCLLSLYNTPIEKREKMGRKGRTFIETNLTWKSQVTKTIDFIKELKI